MAPTDLKKLHGILRLVIAARQERIQMIKMICNDLSRTKQLNRSQSLLREGCTKSVDILFDQYGADLNKIPELKDMNKILSEERMNLLHLTISAALNDLSKEEFDTQYSTQLRSHKNNQTLT